MRADCRQKVSVFYVKDAAQQTYDEPAPEGEPAGYVFVRIRKEQSLKEKHVNKPQSRNRREVVNRNQLFEFFSNTSSNKSWRNKYSSMKGARSMLVKATCQSISVGR